jgi:CheY-like chemotaxis protein
MSTLNIFGVEASFVRQQLDQVAQAGVPAGSPEERGQVARRAQRLVSTLKGAQALIVNDNPRDMVNFEQILRNLGMQVDIARTTAGALANMDSRIYDVVISDMKRDSVPDEGQRFLEETVELGTNRPTVFGVREFDPSRGTPPYALGITNRTDELLNLVFDALERVRG